MPSRRYEHKLDPLLALWCARAGAGRENVPVDTLLLALSGGTDDWRFSAISVSSMACSHAAYVAAYEQLSSLADVERLARDPGCPLSFEALTSVLGQKQLALTAFRL